MDYAARSWEALTDIAKTFGVSHTIRCAQKPSAGWLSSG